MARKTGNVQAAASLTLLFLCWAWSTVLAQEAVDRSGINRQLLQLEQRELSQHQESVLRSHQQRQTLAPGAKAPQAPSLARQRSEQEQLFDRQLQEQLKLDRQQLGTKSPTADQKQQFQKQQFQQQHRQLELQQNLQRNLQRGAVPSYRPLP